MRVYMDTHLSPLTPPVALCKALYEGIFPSLLSATEISA